MTTTSYEPVSPAVVAIPALLAASVEYATDTTRRAVLYRNTKRQRASRHRERAAQAALLVLDYAVEQELDVGQFGWPVNYALVRTKSPAGVVDEQGRRPIVIIDSPAGHGGGFKVDRKIGVAMKVGRPCNFVRFLPEPMPGQANPNIAKARAALFEKVAALHPEDDGRPCVVAKECLPKLIQGGPRQLVRAVERNLNYSKNRTEEADIKLRKQSKQSIKSKSVLVMAGAFANAS
jgi:hypothetical protein